jgi:hypothetical protein
MLAVGAGAADAKLSRVTEGVQCTTLGDVGQTREGLRLMCGPDLRPESNFLLMWQQSNLPYTDAAANGAAATALPGIGASPTNFWPNAFFSADLDARRWGAASIIGFLAPTAFSGYYTSLAFQPGATSFLGGFRAWVDVLELKPGVAGDNAAALDFLATTLAPEPGSLTEAVGMLGEVPAYVYRSDDSVDVVLIIGSHMVVALGVSEPVMVGLVNEILTHNAKPTITSLTVTSLV